MIYNDQCNIQLEKGVDIVEDNNWYCSEDSANSCEYRMMLKVNRDQEEEDQLKDEDEEEYFDDDYSMNDF